MRRDTFYTAQNLDSDILKAQRNIKLVKESKTIFITEKDAPGNERIVISKDQSCGGCDADPALFKKISGIMLKHYEAELKKLEAEFAKLK